MENVRMLLQKILLGACGAAVLGLLTPIASAGPISSGGGTSVVCRDPEGKIVGAELLDLYEGRTRYRLRYDPASGALEQDYIRGVANTYRLQGADDLLLGSETRLNLRRFFQITRFTRPGERLPTLRDLGQTPSVPSNCAIEQVAIFKDGQKESVAVDSEIWSAMDSLSQAALVTHELWYKLERSLAEDTSEGTRAAVAHIYASRGATPVLEGIPSGSLACTTNTADLRGDSMKHSVFYVYGFSDRHGKPISVVQFFQLMGRPIVSKATATLPQVGFILGKGDPQTGKNTLLPLVWEEGAHRVVRAPVAGSQRRDWELEVEYVFRKPMKIRLYQKRVLMEEAYVDHCQTLPQSVSDRL